VRDDVLELLIEAAKNVVEEVTVLNARAEIAESVPHVVHLGGVLDDGEVALVEPMGLIAEERCKGVTVIA
jgi:hypothetical protein